MLAQLLVSSIALGSIYALTALGFAIIYRASGVVNFAQGQMMMLGAMAALVLYNNMHFPLLLAVVAAVGFSVVIGMAVEYVAFRPLRHAPEFTVLLSTVAIAQIIQSGVRSVYGQETAAFPGIGSAAPIDIAGVRFTVQSLCIVGISFLTLLAFVILFRYSKLGWAMRAVAQNKRGAAIVGISVGKIYAQTWAIAGGLAAIAGILLAPLILVSPDMGVIGNKGFIAAIIGGFSSLPGAVLGGFLLALLENLIGTYISSGLKDVITFVLMVLLLLLRPQGLLGQRAASRV